MKLEDENGAVEEIQFHNFYRPANTELTLNGVKVLQGNELEKGMFQFDLYETDSAYQTGNIKSSTKNAEDGSFAFDAITYRETGSYYYVVRENKNDAIPGIAYDDTIYQIQVDVKDDENGKLFTEMTINAARDGKTSAVDGITFTNTYSAEYAVLEMTATKKLINGELKDKMFAFNMNEANVEFKPLKVSENTYNNANGEIVFDAITYTEPGTYYYVIEENTDTKLENVVYDTTKYYVKVTVTDVNGKLQSDVEMQKSTGEVVNSIAFSNTYTGNPSENKPHEPTTPGHTMPYTGGRSVYLWLALMLSCMLGAGVLIIYLKKTKQ